MRRKQFLVSGAIVCVFVACVFWLLEESSVDRSSGSPSRETSSRETSRSAPPIPFEEEQDAAVEAATSTDTPPQPTHALAELRSELRVAPPPEPPRSIRFSVSFGKYRPPVISGAVRWRLVAYRALPRGCQPVQASPLGGPLASLVFRTNPLLPSADSPKTPADLEVDPATPISIAVFFAAVPYDLDDELIPGIVETYAGEVHSTVGELKDSPGLTLVRSRSGSDWTIAILPEEDSPSSADELPFEYVGSVDHLSKNPRVFDEWEDRFTDPFPIDLAPFEIAGKFHMAPISFPFTVDKNRQLRVYNWPDHLILPSQLMAPDPTDRWFQFAAPFDLSIHYSKFELGVVPLDKSHLEYRPNTPPEMPTIEFFPRPQTEGFVVIEEPFLSAIARYSEEHEEWRWQIRALTPMVGSRPIEAYWIAPGYRPDVVRGSLKAAPPLRFQVRKGRGEDRLVRRIVVEKGRTHHLPVVATLMVTVEGKTLRESRRLVALGGEVVMPLVAGIRPATLEVELDLRALGQRLREKYAARWGVEFEPFWLRGERVERRGTTDFYEITVHSERETWEFGKFLDQFQLR